MDCGEEEEGLSSSLKELKSKEEASKLLKATKRWEQSCLSKNQQA